MNLMIVLLMWSISISVGLLMSEVPLKPLWFMILITDILELVRYVN